MSYILKDIEDNCKQCDIGEVVQLLKVRGDLDERHEYYRSIWYFYNESRSLFPKGRQNRKQARKHTMEMLGVSYKTLRNAITRMRRR